MNFKNKGFRHSLIIFSLIGLMSALITSCGSSQFSKEYIEKYDTGEPNLLNDFHNLRDDTYFVPYLNRELTFIQFNGTASVFYTDKAMFDNHGPWTKFYFDEDQDREFILWREVIMTRDRTPVNIITSGDENPYTTKASFAVFDMEGKDLLVPGSEYRQELIDEMAALIRQNNEENKEFYKRYWAARDPRIFEIMLKEGKFDPEPKFDMKR